MIPAAFKKREGFGQELEKHILLCLIGCSVIDQTNDCRDLDVKSGWT